jgi:hypothetical protein
MTGANVDGVKAADGIRQELNARDQVARLRTENAAQRATIDRFGAEVRVWRMRCENLEGVAVLRRR